MDMQQTRHAPRRGLRARVAALALLPALALPASPDGCDAVFDPSGDELQRYLLARELSPRVTAAQAWTFHQAFATLASFVGDYDASPWRGGTAPDPAREG